MCPLAVGGGRTQVQSTYTHTIEASNFFTFHSRFTSQPLILCFLSSPSSSHLCTASLEQRQEKKEKETVKIEVENQEEH